MGLLSSSKAMKMFGSIMTVAMTWKQRGLNPLEELRKFSSDLNRYKKLDALGERLRFTTLA